jgi:hypothetical protein
VSALCATLRCAVLIHSSHALKERQRGGGEGERNTKGVLWERGGLRESKGLWIGCESEVVVVVLLLLLMMMMIQ